MQKFLFALCLCLICCGCAQMKKMLAPAGAQAVGHSVHQLIQAWGVPARTYQANGIQYLEYIQSYYDMGWHNYCTTTFMARNDNIIFDYRAVGNNCKHAGNFVQNTAPVYQGGGQADPLYNPNSLLNMF